MKWADWIYISTLIKEKESKIWEMVMVGNACKELEEGKRMGNRYNFNFE